MRARLGAGVELMPPSHVTSHPTSPKGSAYPLVQKLMWDRLIQSPPYNSVYIFYLNILNGKSGAEAVRIVRANIFNVVTSSFK